MNENLVIIEDRVKKVIEKRLKPGIGVGKMSSDTPLIGKGLSLDSVGILELVVGLEQEFKILFNDTEMTIDLFENIGSLTNYISGKLHNDLKIK